MKQGHECKGSKRPTKVGGILVGHHESIQDAERKARKMVRSVGLLGH